MKKRKPRKPKPLALDYFSLEVEESALVIMRQGWDAYQPRPEDIRRIRDWFTEYLEWRAERNERIDSALRRVENERRKKK